MKKTLLWLLLLASAGAQPYRNPVLPYQGHELADPHVLKYNGHYYLYTSGDPIMAHQSEDLVHWKSLGPVLKSTPGTWNEADVWAPEVIYRNGTFYMFYTASRKSSDWRVNEMARRVGVATSQSPAGPFVDSGAPLFDGWAIDGTVFQDPVSGKETLYFSQLQEPDYPGAAIAAVPLSRDDAHHSYRIEGKPQTVVRGGSAWEDKDGDPNNGSLRYTNEGPTVFERDGKIYLMYSAGSWDMPTYAVGYAVADSALGPFRKVEPPVLKATPLVDGPGHNAVVMAPNNLDLVHVYHARTQPYLDPWNRMPFVDRLDFIHERLSASPPSLAWLEAPAQPLLRELFERPLDGRWTGDWKANGGVLRALGPGRLEWKSKVAPQAVLEVNFKPLLDSVAGVALGTTMLTPPATPNVFHQLLLYRQGKRVEIFLDGVRSNPCEWTGPDLLALSVSKGQAEFAGVSVTAGWRTGGIEGWQKEGDLSWRADSPPADHYEFSAALRPDDLSAPLVEHPGPSDQKWLAGIVAARDERGGSVTIGYDKAIWPLARLKISYQGRSTLVGLPRGFRYDQFHSLRVRRFGDAFTFFMDNREVASGRYPLGPSQVGVLSQGVKTDFADLRYQQLHGHENLLLNGGFEGESEAWKLTGSARLNESSPHSGLRRLLLREGAAEARQTLLLQPGDYLLHSFVIGTAGQRASFSANGQSLTATMQGQWQAVDLPFTVVHAGPQTISLQARLGADAYLAADDLYLEARP